MPEHPQSPTNAHAAADGVRPVILVLDFPGHRPEARLSELRLEEAGYDVRELLVRPLPRDLTAEAYAIQALTTSGTAPEGVHAVLGYCMGASLAQRVASVTSAGHLLLFDAERATEETITGELRNVLRSFDPEAELPPSLSGAELAGAPESFMERIDAHLFSVISAALREGDDGPYTDKDEDLTVAQVARGLMGTYLDWLAHLVAASDTSTEAPARGSGGLLHAVHVTSSGHPLPEDWAAVTGMPRHVVETGRNDLARTEETRALTLRLLRAEHPMT
ncbi:hypothetical protein [Streptomyces sp. NPDC012508]|uniref:hypothetical protein n=1 Tax=Streptomyces sp. NPDC012508 TaxID=3364837 RepID=UPI0036D12A53